jgi:acetyl-CoA carboxylase, biotin carboxylase subunit
MPFSIISRIIFLKDLLHFTRWKNKSCLRISKNYCIEYIFSVCNIFIFIVSKCIEETPSPALKDELREDILCKAVSIIKEIGYDNVGTVEFLLKGSKYFFMEINARIQVEHPVTELVTGVDIVEQQLRVALGQGLSIRRDTISSKGHAIECRINAEHPLSFAPISGKVNKFVAPSGEGN